MKRLLIHAATDCAALIRSHQSLFNGTVKGELHRRRIKELVFDLRSLILARVNEVRMLLQADKDQSPKIKDLRPKIELVIQNFLTHRSSLKILALISQSQFEEIRLWQMNVRLNQQECEFSASSFQSSLLSRPTSW
jgi:ATP phosphoribosyltransferase